MAFQRSVLVKLPPKTVFQVLCDVTILEEFSAWKVTPIGDSFGEGSQWKERRFLRTRTWTVTAYDRRAMTYSATWNGVTVSYAAKKGGTWSSNVQMHVDGEPHAVARFEKSDGDRLDLIASFLSD